MKEIDVADKFKSQDYPVIMKDPDYTDHPGGAEDKIVKVQGVISQTGLHKRKEDGLQEKAKLKLKQVPPGKNKPVQNVGILSAVDRFFNFINRMLGD